MCKGEYWEAHNIIMRVRVGRNMGKKNIFILWTYYKNYIVGVEEKRLLRIIEKPRTTPTQLFQQSTENHEQRV